MDRADIRGKWALVTGASRGIGRQVSAGLAGYGCNVVLHSRDNSHTASLAKELSAKGIEVRQLSAELGDPVQVEAMLNNLLKDGPNIDILYNNAAVQLGYTQDWLNFDPEDIRKSFETNCTALIRICHRLIPGMIARDWGRIINVTSGIRDQPEQIGYSISKAAVDKFVYDTAPHLKDKGVLMNLLDPGWLKTDMGGAHAPGEVESVLPGALVPALLNDGSAGKWFNAQEWAGKEL